MSAPGNMTMRAKLERNIDLEDDAYGQPEKANFQPLKTLPCRVWSKTRREVNDADKIVLVEDIRGRFETGADIRENDRISSVVDRRGAELFAGPLDIVTIVPRTRHQEVFLERFQ